MLWHLQANCWYLNQHSSYPKPRDGMASPVWVPPSRRCPGFPGFIQAGDSPAHSGRWDLESLHPSSPCQSPVDTEGQAWGHIHPTQPWDPWGLPSLPPFVTLVRCGQQQGRLRGFVPMGMANSRNTDVIPGMLYSHTA